MASILQPKRILLWKEILESSQNPDMGVVDELLWGTNLVGEVPSYMEYLKSNLDVHPSKSDINSCFDARLLVIAK